MTNQVQYAPSPASAEQFCQIWSTHVDALDRHLSVNTWALRALTVVLIAYPIARIVVPSLLHGIVPDVIRAVLNWI